MTLDFDAARRIMVDRHVRPADVTNPQVIAAFLAVPREAFLPDRLQPFAYSDDDLQVAPGRYLAPPAQLARLVQATSVKPDEVVLVIGGATGYAAAIFSGLCSSVVALEADHELAATATSRLAELGFGNVVVVEGPLAAGYAGEGPYDVIFIEGAIGRLPDEITAQLKEGGRLVAVAGTGNAAYARLWIREAGAVSDRRLFNCALKPLQAFEKTPEFEF
ncbi:MAG: protein-L-isoaspartate O-methyltransferase [Alphaproteobacteria bacterium]|nr:MAG: protein-L-isoaspartate O-methyltransferase [Alphaproteobacteria bacterium]